MHPLHTYLEKQLAEKLKTRKVVVWYDPPKDFSQFVDELRGGPRKNAEPVSVRVASLPARLVEYAGSMFEMRMELEPFVAGEDPETAILYLPGCEHDPVGSVLLELEKAGELFTPSLKKVARNLLKQKYTDGVIDEILAPERITYEDIARASSTSTGGERPSVLKGIFHEAKNNDQLLAAWLTNETKDAAITEKDAITETNKLIRSHLGLDLGGSQLLAKNRALTLRYVLAGEFRSDLRCPPPASLETVPSPNTSEALSAVRDLARLLRTSYAETYAVLADRVEQELSLGTMKLNANDLGTIDTFRFEERALLQFSAELIAQEKFTEALSIVDERASSFWLERDVSRKAQWEACRRMAELGDVALSVRKTLANRAMDAKSWVEAYTAKDGWYKLDQAQRRLESWVANLDEDLEERALGVVRRLYDDVCHRLAEGFTRALEKAGWTVAGALHQTRVYNEIVAAQPKPVAYFLVDAMRYEMGVELAERLPKTSEVSIRHAIAALPSITTIGMAALQPGAAQSFDVIEHKGKLSAKIDETCLPDVVARKKHAATRIPKLMDITLEELLGMPPSKLNKKVDGAQVIVVRSQEIDHAGEAGFTFQARQVMDNVIDNIARAIRKLAAAGVEHAVVSADHGHLFFATDRDESMRIAPPGGKELDLHRRCWAGRGGAKPDGFLRVTARALGYASDLEFAFPVGSGVFRAGGDLAFHHGGPSLQELIVPVLMVRTSQKTSQAAKEAPIQVAGVPNEIVNGIVMCDVSSLLGATISPLLLAAGAKVGGLFAIQGNGAADRVAGTVTIPPGGTVRVAMLLSNTTVKSLVITMQDPTTDAELYRSPTDIPVRVLS